MSELPAPFERRVEAYITLLAEVEAEVRAAIEELVARDPQAAGTLAWSRRRLAVLDALLANAVARTPVEIEAIFTDALVVGVRKAGVTGQFGTGMSVRALDLLAQGLRRDINAALYGLGRRVHDVFRRLTLKQVAVNIVAGTGSRVAAKNLQAALVREGTRAFVDKSGREWSLETYSRMAMRTVTREAVSQATWAGLQRSGKQLVAVSHHVNSCDICVPYDGRTFALPTATSAVKAIYPVLESIPPFHPNCKHVISPAAAEFDMREAELLGSTT